MTHRKKILFLQRNGPYGQAKTQEALDAILMASSFDQEISLLFLDDGVLLLKANQNSAMINAKNFTVTYKALNLYGIDKVYVDRKSLEQRKIIETDLMIPVEIKTASEIAAILQYQDAILSF